MSAPQLPGPLSTCSCPEAMRPRLPRRVQYACPAALWPRLPRRARCSCPAALQPRLTRLVRFVRLPLSPCRLPLTPSPLPLSPCPSPPAPHPLLLAPCLSPCPLPQPASQPAPGPAGTRCAPSARKVHFFRKSSPILKGPQNPFVWSMDSHDFLVPKVEKCKKVHFFGKVHFSLPESLI